MATDAQSAERRMIMRLIDADRAIEIVHNQGIAHPNAYHLTNYATLILREAPTVDAMEVVRCKDCKYYCQDKINGVICRHPALDFDTECFDHWINTNPDDFCSYGELKEGVG